MDSQNQTPAMNQKIFNVGLSVETVSVYLICCNLSDNDMAISTKNLSSMWNGAEALLLEGLLPIMAFSEALCHNDLQQTQISCSLHH